MSQANPSNIMAVYIDGFKTAESTSDRAADNILRDCFRSLDVCLCSCELGGSCNRRRYHQRNEVEPGWSLFRTSDNIQAADCLCRAAGIFHYVYETILPKFYAALSIIPGSKKEHAPVDISREVVSAEHRYSLDPGFLMVELHWETHNSSPSNEPLRNPLSHHH